MSAVNVGGCLVPVAVAVYETAYLVMAGWGPFCGLFLGLFINTVACYWLAQSVEGIGIAMPGLFPPLLATTSTLFLVPDQAPPAAFVAGALGPLIARICFIFEISKQLQSASAAPEPSTGSCRQASLRHIWRKRGVCYFMVIGPASRSTGSRLFCHRPLPCSVAEFPNFLAFSSLIPANPLRYGSNDKLPAERVLAPTLLNSRS